MALTGRASRRRSLRHLSCVAHGSRNGRARLSSPGGCWPTPHQESLLKAALLSGPEAQKAWTAWRDQVTDLTTLDHASVRLLPLLHANLTRLGVSDPWAPVLRGAYRKAWYTNRVLLHALEKVVRALEGAGVPTMALKGSALVAAVYSDVGLRPMNDIDLLVHPGDLDTTVGALAELGFRPYHGGQRIDHDRLSTVNAAAFVDPRGHVLDLHWHVLRDSCGPDADGDFWARAVPTRIGSATTSRLGPSDQLIHIISHGVRWNPVPPFRWVADAFALTNSAEIDWTCLLATSRTHGTELHALSGLRYLARTFPNMVPPEVIAELARTEVEPWRRREFKAQTRPASEPRRLAIHWYRHRRNSGARSWLRRLLSFPEYLRSYFGLDSALQIPRFVLRDLPRLRGTRARREQSH